MFYIMTEWNKKTNSAPYFLSLDNNKIQATADLTRVENPNNRHQSVSLAPNGTRLPLPPYSHDLNRPVEHIFGSTKHLMRCALYANGVITKPRPTFRAWCSLPSPHCLTLVMVAMWLRMSMASHICGRPCGTLLVSHTLIIRAGCRRALAATIPMQKLGNCLATVPAHAMLSVSCCCGSIEANGLSTCSCLSADVAAMVWC